MTTTCFPTATVLHARDIAKYYTDRRVIEDALARRRELEREVAAAIDRWACSAPASVVAWHWR